MDQEHFDRLTQRLAASRSRRSALGAIAGALAFGSGVAAEARKRKSRGNRKSSRGTRGIRAEQVPASCFTGTRCTPGPGANLAKCDYGETSILAGANVKGANLSSANLRGADASRANLQGANLSKACLVDADLTGAKINSSTNLSGAISCRTTMPDGSTNDSGCSKGSACCPTCINRGSPCGNGIAGACCGNETCREGFCGGCQNDDQCPAGRVCCNTVCCAEELVCRANQCAEPTCEERCPASCAVCLFRLGGGITCSGSDGGPRCGCNANTDCNSGEICITGGSYRNSPLAFAIACPSARGACATPTSCA